MSRGAAQRLWCRVCGAAHAISMCGAPLAATDGHRSLQQIMADFECTVLEDALRQCGGDMGRVQVLLQTPRKTLYDKLARYQLRPGDFR